jgi:hypothetical protein
MRRYEWQPGTRARYDLFFGEVGDTRLLAWMKGGGCGVAFAFSKDSYIHHTYIEEKMDVNSADAAGLLEFLHVKGCAVGIDDRYTGKDYLRTSSRCLRVENSKGDMESLPIVDCWESRQ